MYSNYPITFSFARLWPKEGVFYESENTSRMLSCGERRSGILQKEKSHVFSKMSCLSANSVFKIPDIKQVFHLWYGKQAKKTKNGCLEIGKA